VADERLRATPEQLCDALGASADLKPVYRRLLKMILEQLQFLEQQISQLDQVFPTFCSCFIPFVPPFRCFVHVASNSGETTHPSVFGKGKF
jgi:hypothetical protein